MGVSSVEDVDCLEPIDVFGIALIGDLIAGHFMRYWNFCYLILASSTSSTSQSCFSIDFYQPRRSYNLTGVWVLHRWFQFGDVSHKVHLDVSRGIHPVGVGGFEVRVFDDFERAFTVGVKLPGWSCGTCVLGK